MKMTSLLLPLCLLGPLVFWAQAPAISPEDAPYSPLTEWVPNTYFFQLDGQRYLARIAREAVLAGPAWDTFKPLPLSFAGVEEVARIELRKLVTDERTWRVKSFEFIHLPNTSVVSLK
jgi:hypothetical protein